jgi:uncharacterized protein DUF4383
MDRGPARLYAGVVGAILVVAGIVGFFYEANFTSDKGVRDAVFGMLDVNGWHNVVHIATGALGLLAYSAGGDSSRLYAIGLGLAYIAVAIWGFAVGDGGSILSIIPVNTEDNVLHSLIGVLGVLTFYASAETSAVGTGLRPS